MGLFEDICSYDNLLLAFDRVEENAGTCGIDNVTIEEFSCGLQQRLIALRKSLLDGTYNPDALKKVGIPKENDRIRWLSIPTVRDRVVQTSAAMVLDPILDKEFEDCSFAYRKERSVQKAIRRIVDLRDKGYVWVVDADITLFFDEIDHEILLRELKKYVTDERVTDLIRRWLNSDIVHDRRRFKLMKGVPQGSPISPLLSNLYLDSFDELLQSSKLKHVRFADDFIVLCKERPKAEDALELTGETLKRLKLSLNAEKTRLVHFNQGFRFLGVEFLRSMAFRPVYGNNEDSWKSPQDKPATGVIKPPATFLADASLVSVTSEAVNAKSEGSATPSEAGVRIGMPDDPEKTSPTDSRSSPAQRKQPLKNDLVFSETAMAEAFKKAIDESGLEEADSLFLEKPEVEPSDSGDPFLRTLYLLQQGAVLSKENERFVVLKSGEVIKEIPAIKVDQILVFGNIQITTQAMKFCLESDIPIILLSSRGKYFGSIESFKRTNVDLHRRQFERSDDRQFALGIAKAIVRAKIVNSKILLQRYTRRHGLTALNSEIREIDGALQKVETAENHEVLLGMEGFASACYFSAVRKLVSGDWGFEKREKQPPRDPVNSLLSYGYTILFYNMYAMIRKHGLHPYAGFLHGLKPGHPSLVSDLIEEFRAPVVDAMVLGLISRGSLRKEDFIMPEDDGSPCLLGDDARKVFLHAFEAKMNSRITHPQTGYKVDYRRCMDLQVQSLQRMITGTAERYYPFTIK